MSLKKLGKRLGKKLGISFATLAVLFVIGEAYARIAEPGPFSLFDSAPYLEHPTLGHVHKPGFEGRWDGTWYEIDSRGMRGPELPESKGENEYRVVCLGDSCTFGKGVVEADTWPRQLERLLQAEVGEARTVTVANLGVNGYEGRRYRDIFMERGLALQPDLVVIGYNLNDFPNTLRAQDQALFKERKARKLVPDWLRDALSRTALYRLARATYYDMNRERDWQRAEEFARGTSEGGGDSEVWQRQADLLAEIAEAAAAKGAPVAVFLFPYESQVYLDEYDDTPILLLAERCEALGLPFVSLEQEFRTRARSEDPPKELFLKGDRYHPRPVGYAIVAEAVLELLRTQGWVPGA